MATDDVEQGLVLVVTGEIPGHEPQRPVLVEVVDGEPDGAVDQGLVEVRTHRGDLTGRRGPFPCGIAHHVGAQGQMSEVAGNVERSRLSSECIEVLRPAFPGEGNLTMERFDGQVLEETQQVDELVTLCARERRE